MVSRFRFPTTHCSRQGRLDRHCSVGDRDRVLCAAIKSCTHRYGRGRSWDDRGRDLGCDEPRRQLHQLRNRANWHGLCVCGSWGHPRWHQRSSDRGRCRIRTKSRTAMTVPLSRVVQLIAKRPGVSMRKRGATGPSMMVGFVLSMTVSQSADACLYPVIRDWWRGSVRGWPQPDRRGSSCSAEPSRVLQI